MCCGFSGVIHGDLCPLLTLAYSWCFQPSVYLRLLENPTSVAPQTPFLSLSPLSESGHVPSASPPCPPSSRLIRQPSPEGTSHDSSSSLPSSDRSSQQVILVYYPPHSSTALWPFDSHFLLFRGCPPGSSPGRAWRRGPSSSPACLLVTPNLISALVNLRCCFVPTGRN